MKFSVLFLVDFFLLGIFYLSKPVTAQSLVLKGSARYGVLNESFTLTCTVENATNLDNSVEFVQHFYYSYHGFASFTKHDCSQPNVKRGYKLSCGAGTDDLHSSTKTYTLEIEKVALVDVISWLCFHRTLGKYSDNDIYLDLNKAAGPESVIITPSVVSSLEIGRSRNIYCFAHCQPLCTYTWQFHNEQISTNGSFVLKVENRNQSHDVYTCTATNPHTSKSMRQDFKLIVLYGPDTVELNTSSPMNIHEGDDVTVSCQADCYQSCSYRWEFNNKVISSSSLLTLRDVNRYEAGDYTCVAKNEWYPKISNKTLFVNVIYAPIITLFALNRQTANTTVNELSPVTVRCDVASNPPSHITLKKNSRLLSEVTNASTTQYKMMKAGCLDTGFYTCEAENTVKPRVERKVHLSVTCSPRLNLQASFESRFASSIGDDVTVTIPVIANPVPTFTWYRHTDGKMTVVGSGGLDSHTEATAVGKYVLKSVQEKDFGDYQVIVANGDEGEKLVFNFTLVQKVSASKTGDRLGEGIGIGIAIMVGIILLVILAIFIYRRNTTAKSKPEHTYSRRDFHGEHEPISDNTDVQSFQNSEINSDSNTSPNDVTSQRSNDVNYDTVTLSDNSSTFTINTRL